tara:strand:+ start:1861 stop:2184 length:324 start_codon:yes stop_codon:yes gene_type:complete
MGKRNKKALIHEKQKNIAKEKIKELFDLAKIKFKEEPKVSDRYVRVARRTAMKYRLRISYELKRKFCKYCYKYLVTGKNSRVRISNGKKIIYCLECKKYNRIPIKRK